jgi:hypothetical protein
LGKSQKERPPIADGYLVADASAGSMVELMFVIQALFHVRELFY